MALRFQAMLCSNLGKENSDADHIKCLWGPYLARKPHVPHPWFRVSSSKIVKPYAPLWGQYLGHSGTVWCAVCSLVPRSRVVDGTRPHVHSRTVQHQYERDWAWPMLVWRTSQQGRLCIISWSLVLSSLHTVFHIWLGQCAELLSLEAIDQFLGSGHKWGSRIQLPILLIDWTGDRGGKQVSRFHSSACKRQMR